MKYRQENLLRKVKAVLPIDLRIDVLPYLFVIQIIARSMGRGIISSRGTDRSNSVGPRVLAGKCKKKTSVAAALITERGALKCRHLARD